MSRCTRACTSSCMFALRFLCEHARMSSAVHVCMCALPRSLLEAMHLSACLLSFASVFKYMCAVHTRAHAHACTHACRCAVHVCMHVRVGAPALAQKPVRTHACVCTSAHCDASVLARIAWSCASFRARFIGICLPASDFLPPLIHESISRAEMKGVGTRGKSMRC
jgi:hypothetical protein